MYPSPTMQLVKSEDEQKKVLPKMNKVWFNFWVVQGKTISRSQVPSAAGHL